MRTATIAAPGSTKIANDERQIEQREESSPQSEAGPHVLGHLEGFDGEGRMLFRPEGEAKVAYPVAIGIALDDASLVRAVRNHARALVLRSAGDVHRPVLVGLVRERVGERARDAGPGQLELCVDGERISITAQKEIRLKCGRASLTLMENGRVEIRGTYVLSASRGPNKIKGATIALN